MDKQAIYNQIQARFPGAKVEKISYPSRAQMRHEAGETKKRREEAKRLDGEFGRYDRSKPKHLGVKRRSEEIHGDDFVDELTDDGNRLKAYLFVSKNGEFREVRWCDPKNPAQAIQAKATRGYRGDSMPTLDRSTKRPRPEEIPDYPRVKASQSIAHLHGKVSGCRITGMTRRTGSGEILNENIAGVMMQHGHPDAVAAMKAAGVLQERTDQVGNTATYAVASSRKAQERAVKEFNKRQAEARDKGWRGTMSRSEGRRSVWFCAHGGNSME